MSSSTIDLDDTKSLDSLYTETINIGGRVYQQLALDRGLGFTPIDEDERERLDQQHMILQKAFDQRLIFPPIENPQNILDCGYGSAAWVCEVAERYPQCEVIGVDISPHMKPDEIPPNLWLQVDDLNEPFTFASNQFDLVHSQLVVTGIKKDRWRSYIRDCVRVTKPGGWLQFVEWYTNVQSDNGSMGDDHALRQLSGLYLRALDDTRDIRVPMKLGTMMREAGLVEVDSQMIQLPANGWPSTEREREIGNMNNVLYKEGLGAQCNYLLHEYLNMDMPEIHVLVAKARQDLDNLALKPYIGLYVAIGRKPNS